MFEVAKLVGNALKEVIAGHAEAGQRVDAAFNATMILGGQVGGGAPRLFLIYPEGNFIEANADTPFFQIGETKYGLPIILRAFDPEMTFEEAIKLLLVSFASTIKANLSVSLPLDVHAYEAGSLRNGRLFQSSPMAAISRKSRKAGASPCERPSASSRLSTSRRPARNIRADPGTACSRGRPAAMAAR
ncbi:MAG: hypothetical protein ACP5DX_18640 [Paracoccaceae bacterium]